MASSRNGMDTPPESRADGRDRDRARGVNATPRGRQGDGGAGEVVLRQRAAAERILRGHPWVWREAVSRGLEGATPGAAVRVLAPDGSPVGMGIADPSSPIAVRVWTRGR